MTIEEIFNNPQLLKVEEELLRIFSNYAPIGSPYGLCTFNEDGKDLLKGLFDKRKKLLDDMFVMDEEHKSLLCDFNDALKAALTDMRCKAIEAYNAVANINPNAEVNVEARCYLGCKYLSAHPVQTQRAKQVWAILSGSCGYYYNPYKDGVMGRAYKYNAKEQDIENQLLYPGAITNWNMGLDRSLAEDMHLVYAFHHLHSSCHFSILDLLWVRDFTSKITATIDSHSKDALQAFECFKDVERC